MPAHGGGSISFSRSRPTCAHVYFHHDDDASSVPVWFYWFYMYAHTACIPNTFFALSHPRSLARLVTFHAPPGKDILLSSPGLETQFEFRIMIGHALFMARLVPLRKPENQYLRLMLVVVVNDGNVLKCDRWLCWCARAGGNNFAEGLICFIWLELRIKSGAPLSACDSFHSFFVCLLSLKLRIN